jgi:hypothetical protein
LLKEAARETDIKRSAIIRRGDMLPRGGSAISGAGLRPPAAPRAGHIYKGEQLD